MLSCFCTHYAAAVIVNLLVVSPVLFLNGAKGDCKDLSASAVQYFVLLKMIFYTTETIFNLLYVTLLLL